MSFAAVSKTSSGSPSAAVLGRRALPRVGISFPVRLHLAGLPGPLDARARDLGVGGVCIATASRFVVRDLRRLVLVLPAGAVELPAEARWQIEASGEDAFLTGVRFLDIPDETLDLLWDVVHEQAKSLTRWLSQQRELAGLSLGDALDLAHLTRLREFRAGGSIYRQGVQASGEDSIFVVMRGEIVLETRTPAHRKFVVGHVRPGQLFGGMGIVANALPSETALVDRDSSLLEVSRGTFENLKQASPALAFQIASLATRSHLLRLESALGRLGEQR